MGILERAGWSGLDRARTSSSLVEMVPCGSTTVDKGPGLLRHGSTKHGKKKTRKVLTGEYPCKVPRQDEIEEMLSMVKVQWTVRVDVCIVQVFLAKGAIN